MSRFFYFLLTSLLLSQAFVALGQKEYQGLCWEISGNGLRKTSYLYGTMHTGDERAFRFQDGVMRAFKKSKIYAMELNMGDVNYFSLLTSMLMDSTTIKDLLSEEDYSLVSSYFVDTLGMGTFVLFEKVQPFFLTMMVPQKVLKQDREKALDLYFKDVAIAQKKTIIGLETFDEQMAAFGSISYQTQAESLVDAIKNRHEPDTSMAYLMSTYAAGDLDALLEVTKEGEGMGEDFYKVFIVDRNVKMADRCEEHIRNKRTFIAVGAAHLPGEDGVIDLLRKKGYTVQPFVSK
jgi:uncharacterized protein YbaP (TraB family)